MKALVGFAGFGGVEIALRKFGIEATGIEIDNAIAEVNRYNGGHCLTADLLDVDPADYAGWWLYHFSPPCPRFSLARNSKAAQSLRDRVLDLARHQRIINGETEQDIRLARKICEFIKVGQPEYFTLENVWGYRRSLSWHLIQYTLLEEGYGVDAWHLNAVDYGVPQTRRRMIVIARRDGRRPTKPFPTHAKKPDMFTQPWRGWYSAIEDLIPSLPESQFAPWQMDRLPEELGDFLIMTGNTNRDGIGNKPGRGCLDKEKPANTVSAGPRGGAMPKAVLLGQGERSKPKGANEPADTVTANNNQTGIKAIILDNANAGSNKITNKQADEPMLTVTAMEKSAFPKAFVVDCQQNSGKNGLTIRQSGDPIFTMTASANRRTIRAALTSGRVISMTPRALARFQNFPDWFVLPGETGLADNIVLLLHWRSDRELACYGIGNALPPGVYQAVLGSFGMGG